MNPGVCSSINRINSRVDQQDNVYGRIEVSKSPTLQTRSREIVDTANGSAKSSTARPQGERSLSLIDSNVKQVSYSRQSSSTGGASTGGAGTNASTPKVKLEIVEIAELNVSKKKVGEVKDGNVRTNDDSVKVKVKVTDHPGSGTLDVSNDDTAKKTLSKNMDGTYQADIELEPGSNFLTANWISEDKTQRVSSKTVNVRKDDTGPRFFSAHVIDDPLTGKEIDIQFVDDDLVSGDELKRESFALYRQDTNGVFNQPVTLVSNPVKEGRNVILSLPTGLPAGFYQLRIFSSGGKALKDELGNSLEVIKPEGGNGDKYLAYRVQVLGDRLQGRTCRISSVRSSCTTRNP